MNQDREPGDLADRIDLLHDACLGFLEETEEEETLAVPARERLLELGRRLEVAWSASIQSRGRAGEAHGDYGALLSVLYQIRSLSDPSDGPRARGFRDALDAALVTEKRIAQTLQEVRTCALTPPERAPSAVVAGGPDPAGGTTDAYVVRAIKGTASPEFLRLAEGDVLTVGTTRDCGMVFLDLGNPPRRVRVECRSDGLFLRIDLQDPPVSVRGHSVREARLEPPDVVCVTPGAWLQILGASGEDEERIDWLQDVARGLEAPETDVGAGRCAGCGLPVGQKDRSQNRVFAAGGSFYCVSCILLGRGPFVPVDAYVLLRRLGEGGMGQVYLAARKPEGEFFALKVLGGRYRPNAEEIVRFCRESQLGNKLDHPNIIRFLDAGLARGVYYLVMEYAPGHTVREILCEAGRVGVRPAVQIAYQVTKALDYALQHGIVHRDIKPENILIDDTQRARLLDLGLAKTIGQAGRSGVTLPRTVLGSIPYMAPEQFEDSRLVDHRADIYSLGVVLREMVTGAPPCPGGSAKSLLEHIVGKNRRPMGEIVQGLPRELDRIVAKATVESPKDRFESPADFGAALKDLYRRLDPGAD